MFLSQPLKDLAIVARTIEDSGTGKVVWASEYTILIQGDAREVLPLLPEKQFTAVITDPPYGIRPQDDPEVFFELEREYDRLLQEDSWLVFWWSQKNLQEAWRLEKFEYSWTMVVTYQRANSRCVVGWKAWQPVMVFAKGSPKVWARRQDVIQGLELPHFNTPVGDRDFKPTHAQGTLLAVFGGPGIVLDPFAGYGSLLVAAEAMGTGRVIGVEKDPERIEKAVKLLSTLRGKRWR